MKDAMADHSPTPSSSSSRKISDKDHDNDAMDRFSMIVYTLVALAMLGEVGWILWIEYLFIM